MADRIKVNTEILEAVVREMCRLEEDLEDVGSMMRGVDISVSSIRDLQIKTDGGKKMAFAEAFENGCRHIGQMREWVRDVGNAVQKSIELFEEAEKSVCKAFGGAQNHRLREQWVKAAVRINEAVPLGAFQGAVTIDGVIQRQKELSQKIKNDIAETVDRRKAYEKALDDRAKNAVEPDVRKLYEKYKDRINTVNTGKGLQGTYYSAINTIAYSWEYDAENSDGVGTTYYHEVGHAIDDYMKAMGHASSSERFSKLLKEDFEAYIAAEMERSGCSREEAYSNISVWLWNDSSNKGGLSDIMGGFSENKCKGTTYHPDKYWKKGNEYGIPEDMNNEAFAHFFEAAMDPDPKKREYIQTVFGRSYGEFMNIVRAELDRK